MEKEKEYNHKGIHIFLHKCLDELSADFFVHTEKCPSETTMLEFMEWSNDQTKNPTEEQ